MPFLIQKSVLILADGHPGVLLAVQALDQPQKMDTPKFVFARFVAQRFERNGNLDRITIFGQNPLRFHNNVDAEIVVAAFR